MLSHTFAWAATILAHRSDLLVFGSGSLVGFVLGLIGGGGSVLAVLLLVYIAGMALSPTSYPWQAGDLHSAPMPIKGTGRLSGFEPWL